MKAELNLKSAKSALEFCHTEEADMEGRSRVVLVPGHQGRRYRVTLLRPGGGFQCQCQECDTDQPCKAVEYKRVCYHILAAMMHAAQPKGHLMFFQDKQEAERFAYEGGPRLLEITTTGGGACWAFLYLHRKRIKVQKPQENLATA